ncbi:hypothetical protein HSR122_2836 [Halapricum desulfuricans]|uniref:Uncharacterized protein n=1 Tax=Halapricum desulfuricans TaxID=2841257 RepID=A0A897NCK5_9EURY|nr:hypothetical protein HSR122_2836 [Halapricum desulfuricans]
MLPECPPEQHARARTDAIGDIQHRAHAGDLGEPRPERLLVRRPGGPPVLCPLSVQATPRPGRDGPSACVPSPPHSRGEPLVRTCRTQWRTSPAAAVARSRPRLSRTPVGRRGLEHEPTRLTHAFGSACHATATLRAGVDATVRRRQRSSIHVSHGRHDRYRQVPTTSARPPP